MGPRLGIPALWWFPSGCVVELRIEGLGWVRLGPGCECGTAEKSGG